MDDPYDFLTDIEDIKETLQSSDLASAAAKVEEYVEKQNNILLNIAVTGESGSGKSTFTNAFRGIDTKDERAAPTGCVETTMEVTEYVHPKYPNVKIWDLPGIGTTTFPADKYLEHVEFKKFDFFIIVSETRFRENDAKLAQEIQKMGKKFYFVRTKIDHNMRDEERSQREFDPTKTLDRIRKSCIQGLEALQIQSPKVFLVSNFDLHLYDFKDLCDTLEKELPQHQRDVLLLALPNINLEIINKKKEALQAKIKYQALLSAFGASVPVPGLSGSIDLAIAVKFVVECQVAFGLDSESLVNLSWVSRVPLEDLRAELKSPLAVEKITKDLVLRVLSMSVTYIALMATEEGSRFIPVIGIPVAIGLSMMTTYKSLTWFLSMLAEDAQRVFTKALALNTPYS